MAYEDDFVPAEDEDEDFVSPEEENDIERQLADQKMQDRADADQGVSQSYISPLSNLANSFRRNNDNSNNKQKKQKNNLSKRKNVATRVGSKLLGVGNKSKNSNDGSLEKKSGKLKKGVGLAAQTAGLTGQVAGKAIEFTGKGMKQAGKGMEKGGKSLMRAGSKLSSTGVGAIAGIPIMLAGGAMTASGTGVKTAGSGVEKGGKMLNKTAKKVKEKGKAIRKKGKKGIKGTKVISSKLGILNQVKTDKKDGINLVGSTISLTNKATGGSPLSKGFAGVVIKAIINFFKSVVGVASKNLLRLAWATVFLTMGWSLIYIVFHGLASYILGRRAFCRLGEELLFLTNLNPAGKIMNTASKMTGKAASLGGSGFIGNAIASIPRRGLEMVEWMTVVVLLIIYAAIWLIIFLIFVTIVQGFSGTAHVISAVYNAVANSPVVSTALKIVKIVIP